MKEQFSDIGQQVAQDFKAQKKGNKGRSTSAPVYCLEAVPRLQPREGEPNRLHELQREIKVQGGHGGWAVRQSAGQEGAAWSTSLEPCSYRGP